MKGLTAFRCRAAANTVGARLLLAAITCLSSASPVHAAMAYAQLVAIPVNTVRSTQPVSDPTADRAALRAVVRAVCDKKVVLLGEALHDSGHTFAFKTALVQELVKRCDFNAVAFEGSYYEFAAIEWSRRQGRTITGDMVGTAIGGLWKFEREVQPLLPFLAERINAGKLTMGGIDFQLGGYQQDYANDTLAAELTEHLEGERRADCRVRLKQRIYGAYAQARQAELLDCVSDISAALRASGVPAERKQFEAGMLENVADYLAVDTTNTNSLISARDHRMFVNFQLLERGLSRKAKIIVWTATAHAAKDASLSREFATVRNFGAYLHEAYGERAAAIGFTSLSGSYRFGREIRPWPSAPADSLEAYAFRKRGRETTFFNYRTLRRIGVTACAVFAHEYHTADWSKVLDGVVVFHTDYPPQSTRLGDPR